MTMSGHSGLIDILSSDSSDDERTLLPQVFARPPCIEGEDLSLPPMNGEQYLRRVIEETKKCDAVVVANIKKRPQRHNQLPDLPEKKECSNEMLFSKDGQITTLAEFSRLRLDMETCRNQILEHPHIRNLPNLLPKRNNDKEWLKLVLQERPDVVEGLIGPSTRLCLTIPQGTLCNVLVHFSDWLSNGVLSIQDSCRWIYSLLACLELPIHSNVYFTLRQIARTLISRRAELEGPHSEDLPHINVLVCIIGRYFSQLDLADPYI